LIPYAFTWNVASGGEWRFTMHAYPLYIVAGLFALDRGFRIVAAVWSGRGRQWRPSRAAVRGAVAVAAVLAVGWIAYLALPWFVAREGIAYREDVSIETGPRDSLFFPAGWSAPHTDGVLVRVSEGDRATIRLPLPDRRSYDVVVRLDPVAPERQQRVTVLLNRQLLGSINLRFDPQRMGSYRLRLPEAQVRAGTNELTLVPDAVVTAASAGPRFAWLESGERLGFRMWYVRVLAPAPQAGPRQPGEPLSDGGPRAGFRRFEEGVNHAHVRDGILQRIWDARAAADGL
jgi:hypothetical protein